MSGEYPLSSAVEHPQIPNLFLLTAPLTVRPEELSPEEFGAMLDEIRQNYEFCLIDAPAGLGAGFQLATKFCDEAVVVCTADPLLCGTRPVSPTYYSFRASSRFVLWSTASLAIYSTSWAPPLTT